MNDKLSRNKTQQIINNNPKKSLNSHRYSMDERLTKNITNSTNNTLYKKEEEKLRKELSESNSSLNIKKNEEKKTTKNSKFRERKSVMFTIAPDVFKLQQMKKKYDNLLTETHEEIKSKIKKKNSKSNMIPNYYSPVQKRSKNFNIDKSDSSSKSKDEDSFNLNLINANDEDNQNNNEGNNKKNVEIKIKKVKDKLTPLPNFNKKKMEKEDYSKILQNTVMLRRIEFSLKLKRKNLPKIYQESVIKIQNVWRKYFMINFYGKIVKIQSVYRRILFKKELEKLRYRRKKEKEIKLYKMMHLFVKMCWIHYFPLLKKKLKKQTLPEITIILQREIGTQIGDSFELEIKEEKKEEEKKEEIKEEEKKEEEKKEEEEKEEEKKEEIKNEKSYFYPNICLKTFPRPFNEIGIYLNVLLKRINSKRFTDIDYSLQESFTYEGNTGKILFYIPKENNNNNKKKIKHIQNKSINGLNVKKLRKNFSLNKEKKENQTFLKNKNKYVKEYDVLKDQKYLKKIMKTVNNSKWNYFTKSNNSYFIKKINYLQKEIRKYLKETKKNKIQKFLRLKLFIVIYINHLINNIRKRIISLLKYNYSSNNISTTFDEEIIENDNERMIPTNEEFLEIRKSLRSFKNKKTNYSNFQKKNEKNNKIYSSSISSTIYNDETVYQNVQNIFNQLSKN